MAKASDNLFPYVHLVPGAAPASPAAGTQRLYLDSGDSNKLKRKDSSGVVTTIEGGGAGGGFGSYSSYTPALTAVTTNPTLGTGSVAEGRYAQDNKTVAGHAYIKFGTSGTAAGSGEYRISLPVSADTGMTSRLVGTAVIYDASASELRTAMLTLASATTAKVLFTATGAPIVAHNIPWAWGASDELVCAFMYQAA